MVDCSSRSQNEQACLTGGSNASPTMTETMPHCKSSKGSLVACLHSVQFSRRHILFRRRAHNWLQLHGARFGAALNSSRPFAETDFASCCLTDDLPGHQATKDAKFQNRF